MSILKISLYILVVISFILFISISLYTLYFMFSKKKNKMTDKAYEAKLKKIEKRNITALVILSAFTTIYSLLS